MRNRLKVCIALILCIWVADAQPAFAGLWGWSYSDYSKGSYVPKSGSFSERVYRDSAGAWYESQVTFRFDQYNIDQINDYKNGGTNPGGRCNNLNAYVTVDMTHTPDSFWRRTLDARWVTSNLPNPKFDLENDNSDGDNEESEVVALGTLSKNTLYFMTTGWKDYRSCNSADGGNMQVQFAMSNKPWWSGDYNNCTQSSEPQVVNAFGRCQGNY